MRRIEQKELNEILRKHKLWLNGKEGGVGANLRYADLSNVDLRDADLRDADLRYADLRDADLRYADLRYANLRYADLENSKLNGINTESILGQKIISVQVDTRRVNNRISFWADLGIWTTGCFRGNLEELKKAIEETHKDNNFLKKRYYRAIDYILNEQQEDEMREEE